MIARVLAVTAAALLAFVLGWLAPPASDPLTAATPGANARVAQVSRPGASVGPAAATLARLNPPPVPIVAVVTKPVVAAPPPPPPPDVATVFREAVTAVTRDGQGLAVVLAPFAGAPQRRVLHVGDIFADDWRIAALDRRGASLERRGQRRDIAFFATTLD